MDKLTRKEEELLEEQAKAEALYPYKKDSVEPVAEGAWKGALSTGVMKTLHEAATNKPVSARKMLAYYGIGGVLGALYGKAANDRRAEQAEKARRFLIDRKGAKAYVAEKRDLVKVSARLPREEVDMLLDTTKAVVPQAGDIIPDRRRKSDQLKDYAIGTLTSGALGAGIGGLLGQRGRRKQAAVRGGVSGLLFGLAAPLFDRAVGDEDNPSAAGMIVSGAAAGAVEPWMHYAVGKLSRKFVGSDSMYVHPGDREEVLSKMKSGDLSARPDEAMFMRGRHGDAAPVRNFGKGAAKLTGKGALIGGTLAGALYLLNKALAQRQPQTAAAGAPAYGTAR